MIRSLILTVKAEANSCQTHGALCVRAFVRSCGRAFVRCCMLRSIRIHHTIGLYAARNSRMPDGTVPSGRTSAPEP